jgi:hypothetical protein
MSAAAKKAWADPEVRTPTCCAKKALGLGRVHKMTIEARGTLELSEASGDRNHAEGLPQTQGIVRAP